MRIFKPESKETFHVAVTTEGGEVREIDLRCQTREEAIKLVEDAKIRDIERASRAHRLTAEVVTLITANRKVTVSDAFQEWDEWMATGVRSPKTRLNNRMVVQKWMADRALESKAIGSIDLVDIQRWVNDEQNPAKIGTRLHWVSAIRSFFKFCAIKRYILSDPSQLAFVDHRKLSHEQKETTHKREFTDAEVFFLLNLTDGAEPPMITPGFFRAAIILGRDLGIRLGDICNLEWACFDYRAMAVTVHNLKTGARVEVPMTKRVLDLMISLPQRDRRFVFPAEKKLYDDIGKRPLLSIVFNRFFLRNGFPNYSFHCLRTTLATTMAAQGATMEEIAKRLGHARKSTTKAYVRVPDAAQKNLR